MPLTEPDLSPDLLESRDRIRLFRITHFPKDSV